MLYTFIVLGVLVVVGIVYVATRNPDPNRKEKLWERFLNNPFWFRKDDK